MIWLMKWVKRSFQYLHISFRYVKMILLARL